MKNEAQIEITLRNQIISNQESAQILGMTQDSRLNWEEHIDRMRALNTIKLVLGKNGEETVEP